MNIGRSSVLFFVLFNKQIGKIRLSRIFLVSLNPCSSHKSFTSFVLLANKFCVVGQVQLYRSSGELKMGWLHYFVMEIVEI